MLLRKDKRRYMAAKESLWSSITVAEESLHSSVTVAEESLYSSDGSSHQKTWNAWGESGRRRIYSTNIKKLNYNWVLITRIQVSSTKVSLIFNILLYYRFYWGINVLLIVEHDSFINQVTISRLFFPQVFQLFTYSDEVWKFENV